jgi:hypothetical protein
MILAALLMLAAEAPWQTRCGWLDNPTPGNWWLTDRDGEWTLATQGSEGVPGWETLEVITPPQWVETNGSYGHGCVCASMRVDMAEERVLEIRSVSPRPLKACRNDRRLPKR